MKDLLIEWIDVLSKMSGYDFETLYDFWNESMEDSSDPISKVMSDVTAIAMEHDLAKSTVECRW